jgi:hypothetical protein
MSIPFLTKAARFAAATVVVALLYVAFDVALQALFERGMASGWTLPGTASAVDREAAEIAVRSASRPLAGDPATRAAAWRLGRTIGFVSQFAHNAAAAGTLREGTIDAAMRDASADAQRLGVGPVVPLRGDTLEQAASLIQRIETDELGLAARIEERTTPQHRHLFLTGMHVGMQMFARRIAGLADANQNGAFIEHHARLAGLDRSLWKPLADPPGRDAEQRREAFMAAIVALDRALLETPAPRAD